MNYELSDTIVALSTPKGEGALALIRLSGSKAIEIMDELFIGALLTKADSHSVHFGQFTNAAKEVIDEGLCLIFKGPKSYTKEDTVEITCHGSSFIIAEILAACTSLGARLAEKGEFTMRAYLNGQMDLSQAEAVADLISSETAHAHRLALNQMKGNVSNEIQSLRQELIDFASLIELEIDFSEEDVAFANRDQLLQLIAKIRSLVEDLINSFKLGNAIKKGVPTVLAGVPNAGKSTLLNALVNEERAIVSDIAGTTRDTIEELLNIKGINFRLTDTAGIRNSMDQIEQMGVARTMKKIENSAICVYVFDAPATTPEKLHNEIEELHLHQDQLIIVANKMDQNPYLEPASFYKEGIIDENNLITCSALNKMNIEHLKERLFEKAVGEINFEDKTIMSNARHVKALKDTESSLSSAERAIQNNFSQDLIAIDIRQALHHLGSITGEISTDDLLGNIFSNFCIGK